MLRHEYLAATTPDRQKWDAIRSYDAAERHVEGELRGMQAWGLDEHERAERSPHDFWNEYIANADRAWLKVYRFVPIERVIAIDPLGDGYFPVPHVLVEFVAGTGPFSDLEFAALERTGMHGGRIDLRPEKANRCEIFPKDLPADDAPPLNGFDDTSTRQSSLSESADAKLKELFAAIKAERKTPAATANDGSRAENAQAKTRQFREWREKVALPLFSAFVSRLRAEGHSARVVIRSVEPNGVVVDAQESIELRVRVHVGTKYNPSYRPSGHIRVTLSEHRGWQLDVAPSRDESANRYSTPPQPKVENLALEQLEAQVIAMLERLKTRAY